MTKPGFPAEDSSSLHAGFRDSVFSPGASVQYFLDLRQSEIAFFGVIIKMRRDADSGQRAIVDQNVSGQQFAADFESVWTIHGHSAPAFRRIFRGVDAPAARPSAVENERGHAH